MEKIFLFSVIYAFSAVNAGTHFPEEAYLDIYEFLKTTRCTEEAGKERSERLEAAKCGEHPKKVLVALQPSGAHESILPSAVWVKRCVGMCTHEGTQSDMGCFASETIITNIPIRIFNIKTNKEMCSLYPVEEHIYCACRVGPYPECAQPPLRPRPVKLLKM